MYLVKIEQYLDDNDYTMGESPRRLLRVSRWGTLHAWETLLDKYLSPYGLAYDRCICIFARRKYYDYVGYFTLKHNESVKKPLFEPPCWLRFARIRVSFDGRGHVQPMEIDLLDESHVYILKNLRSDTLIHDRRIEYSWIGNIATGMCQS
jgi:hypothetical protein